MLTQTPAAQRVTLVSSIGVNGADGDSLSGQNVNNFPDGALFYVAATKRFYQLQKNLPVTVVAAANGNVVDGIGSTSVDGRFVALLQSDLFTLSGGVLVQSGWSLPVGPNYEFLVSLVTPGGTPGFPHAARTTDHSVTLTSTQGADTGVYFVVLVPSGEAPVGG